MSSSQRPKDLAARDSNDVASFLKSLSLNSGADSRCYHAKNGNSESDPVETQAEIVCSSDATAANCHAPCAPPPNFEHPVYKKVSAINGAINRFRRDQLLATLDQLGLSKSGSKEVLQKRLKSYCKKRCLAKDLVEENRRVFHIDFYMVLDVEATCEEPNPPGYQHEIIEFPAVLVSTTNFQVVSEFNSFCRPVINPVLSDFCKKLTTIRQIEVESAPPFETVLRRFDTWINQHIRPDQTFAFVTDGPWDIGGFLKRQCSLSNIQLPHYFHRWVNIRKHFQNYYKVSHVNIELMLQHLGMQFQGTPHRGIDDSRNLARILRQLHLDGAELFINESLK